MGVTKKKIKINEDDCEISFFQIFRYATWFETLVILFGTLIGLISGFGACYNLIQLGELSTSFVERTTNITGPSSKLPLLQLFGGGRILENATHEENMQALLEDGIAMAIGMFVTTIICIFLCFVSIALLNWSALKQITRIRIMFLDSVLRQNMTWYDTNTDFNLASRMSEDMLKLREGMGEKIGIVANLVGTAIIGIVSAFPIGWQLALACVPVVPLSVAASVVLSKYQTKSSVKEMNFFSKAGKQVEEVLKSVKTVVAFSGEDKEIKKYTKLLEPAEKYGCKRGLYNGIGNGIVWLLTFSVVAVGMMYGTRLVLRDLLKPAEERGYQTGDILSVLFNIYMAAQSITFCVPHGESFANAKAAAANIFKIIERKPEIDSMSTAGLAPRKVKGEITLENIHFSYPSRSDVTILKNFSLTIKAGEVVALVGSSGCGKSTILQLIQRLYDPHVGTVMMDGRDIKTLNLPWLRSCLGVVGQEPALFRGTIHDNIAIGAPEATRADVQKVAEIAYAHDFISKLPNGYDTLIGERGASLSGGQKQRIAIARSLLREPAVLLLDEATSALDPYSEKQVQAALDRASVDRTTIVVSHRLSTIVNADRIVCMDQGAIVEEGTHEELMNKKGAYWTLVTTGRQVQETDLSESLPEEELEQDKENRRNEHEVKVKRSVSRRSTKSISKPSDLPGWITPRLSISSVMTSDFQHFGCNLGDSDEISKNDNELYGGPGTLSPWPRRSESHDGAAMDIKILSQWEILKLNAPEWPLLVTGSIAAFVQGACFPAFALLESYILGMFAFQDSNEIIHQCDLLSGIIVLVAVLAGIAMCLQSASFTRAGLKMTTRLRTQCFSSLLRQEIGYYDLEDNTVGALCLRLSGDAAEVQGATGLCIGLIIQGVTSVLIGFIMGICYNWKMTLVGTAFLPIMVGSIWLEGIISQKSQVEERAAMESAAAIATEAIISIKTVQSLGVEPVFLTKFEEVLKSAIKDVSKKARWRGLVLGVGLYVPFMAYCSATAYGTSLMTTEDVKYRDVLLVNTAVMYGAYMLGQSLVFAPDFSSAKRCGARIMSMINRKPKINTADGLVDTQWNATGNFNIKNVEFSYPTRPLQKVLKGINLKVDQGKMIALVGSSGCGKSTILQLIQRFYDPDSGSIDLDDKDIKKSLTLPRLRRQLGVVQQEPVLFDGTLAENIAYGDNSRKVTTHDIIAAAKAANIHKFIVSLPKGYDTPLGSGGAQLSGGQKQRICIARALIRSPRLLLLDEATSALDASSEKVVAEALEKAAKGRTCISIAHRLSTIKDADLICVLDKGNIVEQGTHKELLAQRGMYWRMNKTQHVD